MQVCEAMYFCSPRCESRDVRALDGTETSDLCSAMCIAETTFAMRCIFTAICALIAEINCDVGRDGSIAARAMPRCGELRKMRRSLSDQIGYIKTFSQDKLHAYRRRCMVLLQSPKALQTTGVCTHIAFYLLRCSISAKSTYLLAHFPPSFTAEFAVHLDEINLEVMNIFLGNPLLSIDQTSTLRRPVRAGGFGLPALHC